MTDRLLSPPIIFVMIADVRRGPAVLRAILKLVSESNPNFLVSCEYQKNVDKDND